MDEEDIKFLKMWLLALDVISPDARAKVNRFAAIFDNRYVGIDQHENVYIGKKKSADV